MVATPRVSCDRMKWYQVVLSVSQVEVRGRVQAASVDAAARSVMRSHGLAVADSASVWLLGRSGAPSLRTGLRCRLPRVLCGGR
jgi:trimethylamine:corrinoid methyltransferase-like protein